MSDYVIYYLLYKFINKTCVFIFEVNESLNLKCSQNYDVAWYQIDDLTYIDI